MTKPRTAEGSTPQFFATTAYKQWVWRTIRERSGAARGDGAGALQWLVDEMKRRSRQELIAIGKFDSIQTGTLSMFLGPEDHVLPPSNTTLMPAINRALGIAPPSVCDPTDELSQLVEKFRARWQKATPRERAVLRAALADHDDESDLDLDRARARQGSRSNDGSEGSTRR